MKEEARMKVPMKFKIYALAAAAGLMLGHPAAVLAQKPITALNPPLLAQPESGEAAFARLQATLKGQGDFISGDMNPMPQAMSGYAPMSKKEISAFVNGGVVIAPMLCENGGKICTRFEVSGPGALSNCRESPDMKDTFKIRTVYANGGVTIKQYDVKPTGGTILSRTVAIDQAQKQCWSVTAVGTTPRDTAAIGRFLLRR